MAEVEPAEPTPPPSTVEVGDLGVRLEPGEVLGEGRYRIESQLGEGGNANVYSATDLRIDRTVAIKVLHQQDAEARALLRQEAALLAGLHDPRVIAITDWVEAGAALFMVTEYLQGQTLEKFIEQYFGRRRADGELVDPNFKVRPIPTGLTLRIGETIARALQTVHSVGYIHRDLKPANLMLKVSNNTVEWLKLIDFGLSARSGVAATRAGTPHYLAPETAEEHGGNLGGMTGPGTDLYSLGCLLHEMCLGRPPFEGTVVEILEGHRDFKRPPISTGFDKLDEYLAKLLARRLEDRPALAEDVAQELARLDAELSTRSTFVGVAPQAPSRLAVVAAETLKLPARKRLAADVAMTTDQSLAALKRPNLVWPMLLVLAFAVTVLTWWLWSQDLKAEQEVATVTTEAPAATVSPVEVVRPVPEAVLQPLPILSPTAPPEKTRPVEKQKPVAGKVPASPLVSVSVEAVGCQPDEGWRRSAGADLDELTQRAAKRSELLLWAAQENNAISKAIASASTRGDCGAVEHRMNEFKQRLNGTKGIEP